MKTYLALVFILFSSAVLSADEIYNSNILGMKLGRINSILEAESDYYIRVSEDKGIKSESLFENGDLQFIRTFSTVDDTLTEVTKKDKVTETVIRKNGVITSEKIEQEDTPDELTEYVYKNGRLEYTEFFSAGVKDYKESYMYTKNGRLLDVKREYSDNKNISASFFFIDGRLSRYLFQNADEKNYIKFDRNGILFSDSYGEGTLNETREYGSFESGGRFELIKNTLTGESRRLLFNKEDRIFSSIVKDNEGMLIEELSWKYSGGLVTELKIKGQLSLEVFKYEYNQNEEAEREIYLKNGNIIQITEYVNENYYTEELYRYGIPVLKITYKDGVRAATEQLQED